MTDIDLRAATEADFEALLDLRMRALRPHLERLGRYDPVRGRERFRRGFSSEHTRLIVADGTAVGCVSLKPIPDGLEIEHFYLEPALHGRGIGSEVLRRLLAEADALGLPVTIGVLKQSPAARFYRRQGFNPSHEGPFDDYFVRAPGPASAAR
ncbi:MAG: GNAT family N-acetyltransferase [Ferrovibrionaceae bacterium]